MRSSGLSIEAQLVLAAAGGAASDDALCALADQVSDWKAVLDISVQEGAQPAVAQRLRSCAGLTMPGGVPKALAQIERVLELRMAYVRRRLHDVLDDLGRADIPVVLLKGAALASWAYGSFGQRYMSDLDLLVQPEDAQKAHAVLRSTGWKLRFKEEYDRLYHGMHHLMPLMDAQAPAMKLHAEIHTALIPVDRDPFQLTISEFRREARNLDGLPGHVFVPAPLYALWHSCVHFAWSHMFTRGVRTFQDVTVLARSGNVDWSAFVAEAKRTRAESCCYWTLELARNLGRAPVPDDVLRELEPDTPIALRRLVARHLENEVITGHGLCPSTRLRRFMWRAAVRPVYSGHGSHRPWNEADWNEMLANHLEAGEALPADGTPSSRNLSAWMRYMQSLLSSDDGALQRRRARSAA